MVMLKNWKEILRKRREALSRKIEYRRLKRIRRKQIPAYTYCKNCGRKLKGMYCSQCGQYALDIEQPFWKYMLQYIENVYQFDTKVWNTLYLLFRKPGFLTREFNVGKINSYVHPMRLFMFISCLFFLFTFSQAPGSVKESEGSLENLDILLSDPEEESYDEIVSVSGLEDTTIWCITDTALLVNTYRQSVKILPSPYRDTARVQLLTILFEQDFAEWNNSDSIYISSADTLHLTKQANPLLAKKHLRDLRKEKGYSQMLSWCSFYWPIIVLLMIPVFAFMLKMLFRKDKMVYMHHLVFALHIHSVLLLLLAVGIVWTLWVKYYSMELWQLLSVYFLLYTTWAVRRVYVRNHWIKAALKTLLLYIGYLFVLSVVFVYTLWWVSEHIIA